MCRNRGEQLMEVTMTKLFQAALRLVDFGSAHRATNAPGLSGIPEDDPRVEFPG